MPVLRGLAAQGGDASKAAAIDLTLSATAMKKYTIRLDNAARAHDPRLYTSRGPVLRELIGTKNGTSVYCYVLTGGRPLGVGADAGPDPGRDKSHLWHIHLSIIRQFCADWPALDGVLSVLRGESLAAWQARTENPATPAEFVKILDDPAVKARMRALPWQYQDQGQPSAHNLVISATGALRPLRAELAAVSVEVTALRSVVQQLADTIAAGGGNVDTAAILAGIDERLAATRASLRTATTDPSPDITNQANHPQT